MRRLLLPLFVVALLLSAVAPAQAELVAKGNLFVTFKGGLSPTALPRDSLAPISVSVDGTVRTLSGERPPALREITIELSRGGVLNAHGLPVCGINDLNSTSSERALENCAGALVGKGRYVANTAFPEQGAFPSEGRILAFNARIAGRPAILAHIYGSKPVAMTRIITFNISHSRGDYGTVLTGALPPSLNRYGYVQHINLSLFRRYVYRGQQRSYLSAACPAPVGFPGGIFPFARASMGFADGRSLSSTLTRSCSVRG